MKDSKEKKITYYTGNWATDVLDNFTEKQSEKIFKKMKKMMYDNPNIVFVQKRMKPIEVGSWSEYGEQEPHDITGFEYIRNKEVSIKRKNKKIEISKTYSKCIWMWTKRVFWSILVLAIVYGAGTFYPNPIAKKWANEQLRQEHTIWAQNLGLVSKK